MCFSDFPIPEEYPLYLPAAQFLEFLYLYVENFSLMEHINLSCSVMNVQPIKIERENKTRWKIIYKCEENLEECLFDYCIICSWFYRKPFIPHDLKAEVLKDFNGKVIHSIDYKGWREFEDKNVLICGFGNTGGDIACDLSNHVKAVYISTRHGVSIFPRILSNQSTSVEAQKLRLIPYLPTFVKKAVMSHVVNKVIHQFYNQDLLGLSAKSISNVCTNDDICMKIICGKVVVQPGISSCSGNTFTFTNGTRVEDIDAVLLCTGYARDFSFLEDGLISLEKNDKFVSLYKYVVPLVYKESFAFVSMCFNKGSFTLLAEMQARYAAQIFRGQIKLPNIEEMH